MVREDAPPPRRELGNDDAAAGKIIEVFANHSGIVDCCTIVENEGGILRKGLCDCPKALFG